MDPLKEFGRRVLVAREAAKMSQRALAAAAGCSAGYISQIENGEREVGWQTYVGITRALNLSPLWLAGEGPGDKPQTWTGTEISQDDLRLLETWRSMPDSAKDLLAPLSEWMAKPLARRDATVEPAPETQLAVHSGLDELAAHRSGKVRTLRLVGDIAALTDSCSVSYGENAERLGDEVQVDEEHWCEGCWLVKVHGDSMREAMVKGVAIVDSCMLVCQPVQLGEYHKGDIVIASTLRGQVVKRYAGQKSGVITLESVGKGETIRDPKAEEGVEGIRIEAVVRCVIAPREE